MPTGGDVSLVLERARLVLALHCRGAYWKLSSPLARLREEVGAGGWRSAGPLIGVFLDEPATTPPEECRLILAYPVHGPGPRATARTAEAAMARLELWPGGLWAVLEYRGPSADSPAAYARLEAWLRESRLTITGAPEEVYVAEPGTLPGLMHARIRRRVAPEGRAPRG